MTEQDRIEANLNEAKERTPEEEREHKARCVQLDRDCKDDVAKGRKAFWSLSQHFYEFSLLRGWSALDYDTQEDWLAQPELGFDRSAYFRMIRRWRVLVEWRKVPVETFRHLEPSKVDLVVPAIEANLVGTKDALEDARTLSVRELRADPTYNSAKTLPALPAPEDDEPAVGSGEEAVPERETEDTEPQREEQANNGASAKPIHGRRFQRSETPEEKQRIRESKALAAHFARITSKLEELRRGMAAGLSEAGQFTITERVWALRVETQAWLDLLDRRAAGSDGSDAVDGHTVAVKTMTEETRKLYLKHGERLRALALGEACIDGDVLDELYQTARAYFDVVENESEPLGLEVEHREEGWWNEGWWNDGVTS